VSMVLSQEVLVNANVLVIMVTLESIAKFMILASMELMGNYVRMEGL